MKIIRETTPRKVENEPIDIIQQLLLSPEELLKRLTDGSAELYALGFTDGEPDVFTNAIPPVAKVWEIDSIIVENAIEALTQQRDLYDDPDNSDTFQHGILNGKEKLALLFTLIDSLVWLDNKEDRKVVSQLIYFLKDYWAIGEYFGA